MTTEPTNNYKPSMEAIAGLHPDVIAANEALTLSLIRQQELTEAAEMARAELEAEIVVRKKAESALIISEQLASVARMSAVIAHEINNPLAAVTDLLYLAQTVGGMPNEALEYLKTADGELKRVAHITRQTLGFYREINDPTSFHLSSLLDSILDLLQSKIRSKRAIVENRCDAQVQVTAVYGELRQVFSNLLVNSLDAIREDGRVILRASVSKDPTAGTDRIRIVVADDGRGISGATLPKIFEPFFTTKGSIGNGLGLWVSKQIIEKHGGFVQVRSCTNGPHKGTTLSVVLPARTDQVDEPLIANPCGRCLTESNSRETMRKIRASLTTHDLAERLIAYEAALDRTSQEGLSDTCHVCERLRRALSTLLGPDGYRPLMARALIRAKREAPSLTDVKVNDDGSIGGLTGKATEANAVLIAHFVELMETFIGETVTAWLLNDIWPDLPGAPIRIRGRNRDDQHDLAVEAQEVVQTRD